MQMLLLCFVVLLQVAWYDQVFGCRHCHGLFSVCLSVINSFKQMAYVHRLMNTPLYTELVCCREM